MFSNHSTGRAFFALVSEVIRDRLGIPEDWVHVASSEDVGHSVQVALAMTVEDVGGPESGPLMSFDVSRFVEVYDDGQNRWHMRLFDLNESGIEEGENWHIDPLPVVTLDLPDIAGEDTYERVGEHVADILRTFLLKLQPEEHLALQVS